MHEIPRLKPVEHDAAQCNPLFFQVGRSQSHGVDRTQTGICNQQTVHPTRTNEFGKQQVLGLIKANGTQNTARTLHGHKIVRRAQAVQILGDARQLDRISLDLCGQMRRNRTLIHIGTHGHERLLDTRDGLDVQRITRNQIALCIPLVSAHCSLEVGCFSAVFAHFFDNQTGHIGLSDICTCSNDKQSLSHDSASPRIQAPAASGGRSRP